MDEVSKKECLHKIPGMYYYRNLVLYDTTPRWIMEPVKQFRFRDNDVLIAGYPKCGKFCSTCNPLLAMIAHSTSQSFAPTRKYLITKTTTMCRTIKAIH